MSDPIVSASISTDGGASQADLRGKYVVAKSAVKDLAGEATKAATSYAGDVKGRASDWVHEKHEVIHERLDDTQAAVLEYVRKNPYKALAAAAGAGLLLGVLLSRGRS